jgi:hypothetical protein
LYAKPLKLVAIGFFWAVRMIYVVLSDVWLRRFKSCKTKSIDSMSCKTHFDQDGVDEGTDEFHDSEVGDGGDDDAEVDEYDVGRDDEPRLL